MALFGFQMEPAFLLQSIRQSLALMALTVAMETVFLVLPNAQLVIQTMELALHVETDSHLISWNIAYHAHHAVLLAPSMSTEK
jgi:hypothetical protein